MLNLTAQLISNELIRRRKGLSHTSLIFPNTFCKYNKEYYKSLKYLDSKPNTGFFYTITPSIEVSLTLKDFGLSHWCTRVKNSAPPFVDIPLYLLLGFSTYTPLEKVEVMQAISTVSEKNILKLG